jgi:hypothetical protein
MCPIKSVLESFEVRNVEFNYKLQEGFCVLNTCLPGEEGSGSFPSQKVFWVMRTFGKTTNPL